MRKSLQTKVGSPLTRMIIAHNLKNCYARLTPSKKKILTFLTAVASFKYLHAILHAKLTRSFQGVKKSICCCCWNTFYFEYFQMFCYITTYFLDSISEKKKKGCTTTIWTFLFLFDSFPSCSYQSLVVTTTLYRSLLKRKETQPTTKVCFPKRQFFSLNQSCYRAKEQISTSF